MLGTLRSLDSLAKNAVNRAINIFGLNNEQRSSVYQRLNSGEYAKQTDAITKKQEEHFQFDYLFSIELPDLSIEPTVPKNMTVATRPTSANRGDIIVPNSEIEHRVYGVSLPNQTIETEKRIDAGKYWYSGGHADIGTLSLTVDETDDGASRLYFIHWAALIKNFDGTHNAPFQYKRDIVVNYLNTSLKMPSFRIVYTGCFPTNVSDISMSYDSNAILQYNVTLACDDVVYEPISFNAATDEINNKLKQINRIANKSEFDAADNIITQTVNRLLR